MEAGEELIMARATGLGAAIGFAGDKPEVSAAIRGLANQAFPETYE